MDLSKEQKLFQMQVYRFQFLPIRWHLTEEGGLINADCVTAAETKRISFAVVLGSSKVLAGL